MSFEERFANVGRWIDDRIWSFKTRRSGGDQLRGVRDAVANTVRSAKEGAGEQLERVKYMHLPDTSSETGRGWRIAGIAVACVLCMAAGIFLGPRVFGTSQHRLSPEEMAAMEKLRANANRTTLFTPAPAEGTTDQTATQPAPTRQREKAANPLFGNPPAGSGPR